MVYGSPSYRSDSYRCPIDQYIGKLLLTQTLTYAWRPPCLFHVSEYVFDQWFYKEATPKSALVKRLGKRKLTADANAEENDEDEHTNTRTEGGLQTPDALVDIPIDPCYRRLRNDRGREQRPPGGATTLSKITSPE